MYKNYSLEINSKKLILVSVFTNNSFRLGILGGGQLGKMLVQSASQWGIQTDVLDSDPECPARSLANNFVLGDFRKYEDVIAFAKNVDVLTIEIEQVNVLALKEIEKTKTKVYPSSGAIEIIQNKASQSRFLKSHAIQTPAYLEFQNKSEIKNAINAKHITYPFVQKICEHGYDGKGVAIIKSEKDLGLLIDAPSIVQDYIDIAKEISILVSRNAKNEIALYDSVEMVFDHTANLVDYLLYPAKITEALETEAKELAQKIITKLDYVGILAIEMFIDSKGLLWVNEMAPRPHNSGHQTIESSITSQYEQHLRAVLSLPLGDTKILAPSIMLNILGAEGHTGDAQYCGIEESLAIPGVYVHMYGKKQTKPYRKMGHCTVIADTLDSAFTIAMNIKEKLKVISK